MGHTLPNIFPRNTYTYLLRLKSNKKIQYIGFTRPKFFPTNPYRYRLRLILEIKYTTGVIPPLNFFQQTPIHICLVMKFQKMTRPDCVYLALIMKNATQNDRNQIKYFFSFLDCLGLNVSQTSSAQLSQSTEKLSLVSLKKKAQTSWDWLRDAQI